MEHQPLSRGPCNKPLNPHFKYVASERLCPQIKGKTVLSYCGQKRKIKTKKHKYMPLRVATASPTWRRRKAPSSTSFSVTVLLEAVESLFRSSTNPSSSLAKQKRGHEMPPGHYNQVYVNEWTKTKSETSTVVSLNTIPQDEKKTRKVPWGDRRLLDAHAQSTGTCNLPKS